MASIVASSDDPILSKNLSGTILTWNRAAERLSGYRAAEAIGQPMAMLIAQDRRAEERMILARIRRGLRVDHYESVRVRKDGRPVDVSISVSPFRDAAGRIVAASSILGDVTERKRNEAERRDQAERLRALLEGAVDAITSGVVSGNGTG